MSSFADSFIAEIIKVAAGVSAPKVQPPMSPLEMENKMMQDNIDNVNLRVQMDQARQAESAIEQQKQMQQQQQQEQMQRQQEQAAQAQGQAPGPELPGNPQEAVIPEGQ